MSEHEFITVDKRRWCMNCPLFQWKSGGAAPWQPVATGAQPCPRNTPHAQRGQIGEREMKA